MAEIQKHNVKGACMCELINKSITGNETGPADMIPANRELSKHVFPHRIAPQACLCRRMVLQD